MWHSGFLWFLNNSLKISTIASTNVKVTQIGMGGAPLGKLDKSIAYRTLEQAYENGIRYFDTAPLYGAGNSENFFGSFLSNIDREQFTLSSKVGRLILSEEEAKSFKQHGPANSSGKTTSLENPPPVHNRPSGWTTPENRPSFK